MEYTIASRGTNPVFGPYVVIRWMGGTFPIGADATEEEIQAMIQAQVIPVSYITRYGTASE